MQQYGSEAACSTSPSGQYADGESGACAASGRICGNGKVAPLGQYPAPGGWLADAHPGEIRRSRACRTSVDDDRSAEAAGDTRSATQHRSTEKSDVRLQHTGSRAAAPTFPGGRDQQAEPRLGGAGIREFQSRLGSFHVSKRLPATPTCLLQLDRAICWCRGRHSGAHRRLRFAANLIDHRG